MAGYTGHHVPVTTVCLKGVELKVEARKDGE